jgi:hypothetical protein
MLTRTERDLVVVQYPREMTAKLRPGFDRTQWALYRGTLKLIEYSDGQRELYNLARDPRELRDLSRSRQGVSDTLRIALQAHIDAIGQIVAQRAEPPKLDEETIRKLRSLGYMK